MSEAKDSTLLAVQREEIERLRQVVAHYEDRIIGYVARERDHEVERINLCQAVADQASIAEGLREQLAQS